MGGWNDRLLSKLVPPPLMRSVSKFKLNEAVAGTF